MSTPIPPPLRAAAGLAALAIDTARKVPQQVVGLPVLAVSTALQASLKAQQTYAGLVARGDEVLGQLRGQQEDAPWARFDDDEAPAGRSRSAFDAVADDVDKALDPDVDEDVIEVAAVEPEFAAAPGLTEAEAGGLDTVSLNGTRPPGSEPGTDLPAGAVGDAEEAAEALDGYLAVEPPIPGYDDLSIPQLRGRLRRLTAEQVEALVAYERAHEARPPYLTMLENRLTTLRSK
jgi:hypothetical protein